MLFRSLVIIQMGNNIFAQASFQPDARHYIITPTRALNMGRVGNFVDLTQIKKVSRLELKWLIKAYQTTSDQSKFFNDFFTKLAGTKKLQQQIMAGTSEEDIRTSWQKDLEAFKAVRKPYLLY